jgi:putative Holliday junction resolvase
MIYTSLPQFTPHLQKGRPLIALDIGTVRIGIAISDVEYILATPHSAYERRNTRQDMGYLGKLATDTKAIGFVLGLPLAMDGSEGDNCVAVRSFANHLHKKTGLPILLKDERMSTAASTRALSESGMTRKKRHTLDDKMAASFILEGVLEGIKNLESRDSR